VGNFASYSVILFICLKWQCSALVTDDFIKKSSKMHPKPFFLRKSGPKNCAASVIKNG
jgi:hypothetical protein